MGRHILVIDDDIDILILCQTYLVPLGYRVSGASSPAEALKILASERVDLLTLDIRMPKVDGFALLKQIRFIGQFRGPVLMLTAVRSPEDVRTALKLGAMDYMCKPVDRDVFVAKVRAALGQTPISEAA